MSELTRNVVESKRVMTGSAPKGDSLVEVTVMVRYLPYGENELIAHYLTNQASRELVAEIDRRGLERTQPEPERCCPACDVAP